MASPHSRFVEDALRQGPPVIVLSALAGWGKSFLLDAFAQKTGSPVLGPDADLSSVAGLVLLDLGPSTAPWHGLELLVGSLRVRSGCGAVIARRPGADVPGLERAVLSGWVRVVEEQELSALALASGLAAETGGWPILGASALAGGGGRPLLARYIETEIIGGLSLPGLVALQAITQAPEGAAFPAQTMVPDFERIRGLLRASPDGARWMFGPVLARPIVHDAVTRQLSLVSDPADILRRASLMRMAGQVPAALSMLLKAGLAGPALEWFEAEGGYNFTYYFGTSAFDTVLHGFEEAEVQSEQLAMARALRALKNGQLARARQILLDYFGPDALTLGKVYASRSPFSWQYRVFRAIVAIYDGLAVPDDIIERMFEMLEQLPEKAYIHKGNLLNALLEIYVRRRRLPEAESVAVRALANYRAAGAPMLAFYVQLFQAIISILQGDIASGRAHGADARASLDETGFESPNDRRLLRLVMATLEYEAGDAAPLAHFLVTEFDRFADGEIWPSLVEFTIEHGAQSLAEHASVLAALDFLDRWRIHRWPARNLRTSIEVTAAIVLQNANRWLQAGTVLSALQSRVSKIWVEAALDELPLLSDHSELNLLMAWLRAIIHDVPARPLLQRQLAQLMGNHHVTARQRVTLMLWNAYIARRSNNLTAARVALLEAFEASARMDCLAPLREQQPFVGELMADRRLSGFVVTSSVARQVVRRLEKMEAARSSPQAMEGLTRRETRILLLVSEGGSNKFIARTLEVTEATVKFHLSNIYRKLDCKGRSQAIATARSMGWIK